MAADEEPASDPARAVARHIAQAFADYNAEFRAITRRAPRNFDRRDWKKAQRDAVERIELYDRFVDRCIIGLRAELGERARARDVWRQIRHHFESEIAALPDREFTKTFFSSVTRRHFGTIGVDADIEFVATDLDPLAGVNPAAGTRTYANRGSLSLLFEDLLGDPRFHSPWRDFDKSGAHLSAEAGGRSSNLAGR